jgi:signal transduction histidine kinase
MGLGLSISRSTIEAHGGRLWASPVSPYGSLFRFTLPIKTLGAAMTEEQPVVFVA